MDTLDQLTCDRADLRALLEIFDRCHRVGIKLRLTNVPANIHRVFQLTGTTSAL
jgi:anti-anti-sigma regulatory factor